MEKPRLSFWQMFNMSFGFLGIQFGWGLQLANMSAVYERLGARPDDGTVTFDASRVDGNTLTLTGPTGVAAKPTIDSNGARRVYLRDVDGDGDLDLQIYFARNVVFNSSHINQTRSVVLNGRLKWNRPDGRAIRGQGTIRLIS